MFNKSRENETTNKIYGLENKRFEIIHVRKTHALMFDVFMHDEYLNKDIILSDSTIQGLFEKAKEYINNAGLSIDLRINPEPIKYSY